VSNLLWATPIVGGATHDLTAIRESNMPDSLAESELDVLADSGFQGLQRDVATIELPTRRRHKDEALTVIERFFNSILSKHRVRVEHAIGRLKQWRCLTVPKQLSTATANSPQAAIGIPQGRTLGYAACSWVRA